MRADPRVFAALSALLSYPDEALQRAVPELRAALPEPQRRLAEPLLTHLEQAADPIDLQEEYVATFDRRRAHSLHLFEHIHGESRDRGQAMVDLREEYAAHGLLPATSELPDYVPLFLEFLAQIPPDDARRLLGDAIHVLARIGDNLAGAGSPYAGVFLALRTLTDTTPQPLPDPPEEPDGDLPVTFGPGAQAGEPALRGHAGAQPVRFYATDPRRGAGGGAQ